MHGRLIAVPIALVALLGLASCGGASSKPDVPAGFRLAQGPYFAFAHPPAWSIQTRAARTGYPGEKVTEVVGPPGTDGQRPDVLVGATPHYRSGLGGLVEINQLDADTRFPGRRVIRRSDVDVPGAKGARLTEYEVQGKPTAGNTAGTVFRMFDLVALSKHDTAVNMFIAVPAVDVQRARVHDILGSLALHE